MPQPPDPTRNNDESPPVSEAVSLGRWFTGVRREGLLAVLDPADWHCLSAVISFTSRDGTRRFTADQLAAAVGQPRSETLRRLEVLTRTQWQSHPLVILERDPSGQVSGAALAPIELLARVMPPVEDPGITSPALTPELHQELARVGLNHAQIDSLAKRFPEDEIRRQVDWLPARGARNPAALLIRAIEQDWDEPKECL